MTIAVMIHTYMQQDKISYMSVVYHSFLLQNIATVCYFDLLYSTSNKIASSK